MSKFEQSHPHHTVHEVHRPHGHGLLHDRIDKGMRSPAVPATPVVDSGTMPSMDGAGSPPMGGGDPTGTY